MFASPLNPFLVTQYLTHVVMFIIITITKFLESDRLSTALISALIGQFNKTVRIMAKQLDSTHITHALKCFFFFIASNKNLGISCVWISKRALYIAIFCQCYD